MQRSGADCVVPYLVLKITLLYKSQHVTPSVRRLLVQIRSPEKKSEIFENF